MNRIVELERIVDTHSISQRSIIMKNLDDNKKFLDGIDHIIAMGSTTIVPTKKRTKF